MILNDFENDLLNVSFIEHNKTDGYLFIKNKSVDKGRFKLDVFIPGIGMNHQIFLFSFFKIRSTFKKDTHNLLALSLKGFNPYLTTDQQSSIIPLTEDQHVKDAVLKIQKIIKDNNIKYVNFFGFSYGADILYKIGEELIVQNKNIKIKKMVFSDINLNEQTAFLTGKISKINDDTIFIDEANKIIENERNKNSNIYVEELRKKVIQKLKKTEFIKMVLLESKTDEIVLDNLLYFINSYKVNWVQMIESSSSAFSNADKRIDKTIDFLKKYNICSRFIISTRTIKDTNGNDFYNGYYEKVKNSLINVNGATHINIINHFDAISYDVLENDVYKYFNTLCCNESNQKRI